jgi:hypothetical protein
MTDTGPVYIKCMNCGKYTDAVEAVLEKFCSEDCSLFYAACTVCGRYFMRENGFENGACSKECAVKYKMKKSKVEEISEGRES